MMKPIQYDEEGVLSFIKSNPGATTTMLGKDFNLTRRNMNRLMKEMHEDKRVFLQMNSGIPNYFDPVYAKENRVQVKIIKPYKRGTNTPPVHEESILDQIIWINTLWPVPNS